MNLNRTCRRAASPVSRAAALAVAALLLAACSDVITAYPTTIPSSTTVPVTTPSPSSTVAPPSPTVAPPSSSPTVAPPSSPSASAVGGEPGTWSPLRITGDDNAKTFTMVPGQVAVLLGLPMNDGEDLNVKVTNKKVAKFQRGQGINGSVAAPVIIAKAPGKTEVIFSYDDQGATPGTNVAFKVTISVQKQ